MSGRVCVALAALLWSFGGFGIKLLTREYGVHPEGLACARSAAAGIALAWALPGIRAALGWQTACTGAIYAILVGTFVKATSDTSAANAIFLQYFYPLLVAVGARVFFRKAIDRRTMIALALGTAGVVAIVAGSWTPQESSGVSYGLISAVAFAAFVLLQSGVRIGSPVGFAGFYNLIGAAVLSTVAYDKLNFTATSLALVCVLGIVQLGIPYVLFLKGLRSVSATEAALITLLEPILNPVWVWLWFREPVPVSTLVGGAAIVLALAVRFLKPMALHP